MRFLLLALFTTALLAAFTAPVFGNPTPGGCLGSTQKAGCSRSSSSSSSSSAAASSSSGGSIHSLAPGSSKGSTPERRKFDKVTHNSIKGAFFNGKKQPRRRPFSGSRG
ncbi:uncharacterized protein LOC113211882 [Frankliniella occidentalis]|uniref:Uncharacterized protein LOC113211882 n=1 Tax=Frankliniella occidentalis TaxID=133901 RepID=A0A6J1T6B8_FRAOC|nr:uncharacterized protein LOC113211882 [Frankliniella occidentalis]